MLVGFTIVAAPLLFAIVNAALQMNHLSARSEELVLHGVRGTRNNQRMFEEIGALERTARLYQIIGSADLIEVYGRNQQRLIGTLNELMSMPVDAESRNETLALQAESERLHEEIKRSTPTSPRMAEMVNAFPQLSALASKVSTRVSAQIDEELSGLQNATQLAQRNLFWESMLLIPLTLAVVGKKLWPVKPWGPALMAAGDAPSLPCGEGLTVIVNQASGSSDGSADSISRPRRTSLRSRNALSRRWGQSARRFPCLRQMFRERGRG